MKVVVVFYFPGNRWRILFLMMMISSWFRKTKPWASFNSRMWVFAPFLLDFIRGLVIWERICWLVWLFSTRTIVNYYFVIIFITFIKMSIGSPHLMLKFLLGWVVVEDCYAETWKLQPSIPQQNWTYLKFQATQPLKRLKKAGKDSEFAGHSSFYDGEHSLLH